MPAIARSEPFREQVCPLGVCDGSGWILGPEDVARPCECREQRLQRGRSRGVASVIPPRYRGVSFDRPPVSDMARDLQTKAAVVAGPRLRRRPRPQPRGGPRALALRRHRHRQDDAGDAGLEGGAGGRQDVAIYSLPKLLARIRQTYDAEPGGDSYLSFFERLTSVDLLHIDDLGAEKRSDWVLEQLYALINERYETPRSMLITTNLEHERAGRADRPPHGLAPGRRSASEVEMRGDDHRG